MAPGGANAESSSGVKHGEINQGTWKGQLLRLERGIRKRMKKNSKSLTRTSLRIHISNQSTEAKSSSKPLPAAWGSHWGFSEDASPLRSALPPFPAASDAAEELRQKEKSRSAQSCPVPLRSADEIPPGSEEPVEDTGCLTRVGNSIFQQQCCATRRSCPHGSEWARPSFK
ncbi:hypothetical protein ASZ78_011114 [Callipepla squamata]|uniref:Uncharacterized protein n=1 Tax=Callipepla squamata TaxID=9009 RepID=A0A226MLQ8_CALSU|nr:hypothetical protein ASZ78_011114 [Callipepla squamata]